MADDYLKKLKKASDSREVKKSCPKCGHEFMVTIARMKSDPEFVCPACGNPMRFVVIDALDRL